MNRLLLRNASILDPENAEVKAGYDIAITNGAIEDVSNQPLEAPGAEIFDVEDRVVMPGLIDAHAHVMAATTNLSALSHMSPSLVAATAQQTLEGMLSRGFTSVRDAGGADQGLSEAVQQGLFAGPRLFISGLALAQTGGQGDFRGQGENYLGCPTCHGFRSISRIADGEENIRNAIREEVKDGAQQIKMMAGGGIAGPAPISRSHFSAAELRAAVDEARTHGTYVMAHAYSPNSIARAIEAGVRTIEHGNLVDLETARRMAGRAYMVPTLAIYEAYHRHAAEIGVDPGVAESLPGLLSDGMKAIEICLAAGVKVGFGTDLEGMLHPYQLREFALRSEVMTPAQMIASATTVNAEILRMDGRLGVIAPGAIADMLVVNGNPLEDLRVLQDEGDSLAAIVKDGEFFKNSLTRLS